jgi:Rod binding domain-containing protein
VSISPPSDIVLDVAQAVAKPDLEAARANLAKATSARHTDQAFSIGETGQTDMRFSAEKARAEATDPKANAAEKFEAMVLRNFIEAMLPKGSEAVYGKGLAGDMWKSLMSEKISDVVAERGGIGISDRILRDYYKDGDKKVPLAGVSAGPAHEALNERALLSKAMVQEIQRSIVNSYGQEQSAIGSTDETRS